MAELLKNPKVVAGIMALFVFLLTQIFKLPIKLATNHIKNERVRRLVNATILILPFAFGVFLDFLYCTYYLHVVPSAVVGLGYGAAGISLYAVIERTFKVKVTNPYDSTEGKAVIDLVNNVTKDGKIDKNDQAIANDFYNKLNSVK